MIPDLVQELKEDIGTRGFQDFNHPLSIEDFGVDFASHGRPYRYDTLNGFHRYTAAKDLGYKEVFCHIYKTENLDPSKRILLQDNSHGHSRESSLGQVIKIMTRSFPNINSLGLMTLFGTRLRLLLEKEPTTTQNWAAKYLKVAQFPFSLPASYGISLTNDSFKMYQQLRDDICESLDRTWYPKVITLFVDFPEVVEKTFYHALLVHIKKCLEQSKPVVTNAPNFGFDKLVNYLIGLSKIRPFALAYLKGRLVVPQDTQWNTFSEFIDEHCRLQDVPVKETLNETVDYLFGCISDKVILLLKNVSSRQLNEQNPKVKNAVQAVCRLLLEKMRANPSEACTESVKYEVNDQRYTVK